MERIYTFPNAGPQDVAVVDVHHDPLAIEWILVDRTYRSSTVSAWRQRDRKIGSHVAAGVVTGDVPASGGSVRGARVRTEPACGRRGILGGGWNGRHGAGEVTMDDAPAGGPEESMAVRGCISILIRKLDADLAVYK